MITKVDISSVQGDLLTISYVKLSSLQNLNEIVFKENPKKHDLELIAASIEQNGFVDPAKWDATLNGGKGGLVYGNGRIEALLQLLYKLKTENLPPPKGIGALKDTGEWCVPIKFGVDSASEIAAKRLAIDHNNLTMTGGDYTHFDISKMWDEKLYSDLLKECHDNDALPLTISNQDYEEIIGSLLREGGIGDGGEDEIPDPETIESRVKLGDVWKLGRHYVACADCTVEGKC